MQVHARPFGRPNILVNLYSMSHVTRWSRAWAATVMPPAHADALIGPTVWLSGLAAHIQTGMLTVPMLPGPGFGAMPMLIADRFI